MPHPGSSSSSPDSAADALPGAAPADAYRHEIERLTAALRQSELRYQRLLDASLSAVFQLDEQGHVQELNAAALAVLGVPLEEVVGRHFVETVLPEDADLALRAFRSAREQGASEEVELRMVRPSGERRLVRISGAAVSENGRVTGVIGIARDITEERAKEMQFRRAERMAGVAPLLSGVCHELNNPLTSIKSFAELLLLDDRSPDDREALEIVQREAHRAARIVQDLRVVARHARESGAGRGPVDLNEVVAAVLEPRRGELERLGISLVVDLAPGLAPAWAARSQVELVAQHLVSNAEHALMAHPGRRELVVRSYAGTIGVVLHVEDTGAGIEAAHLERIFDPFWTTKQPGEGTGLGLSLVHSIVSDHGGRIRVDARPGTGAAFSVDLPAARGASIAPGALEAQASSGSALRVLVIDDEAPIRYSLQRYLERRGHHVDEAAEGGAALRFLEGAEPYDVIVTDLRMPGLGGEQLVERLRLRGDGLHQRVIFITGDQDSPDAVRVLVGSGIPVVQKPFELPEIAQVIEAHALMTA